MFVRIDRIEIIQIINGLELIFNKIYVNNRDGFYEFKSEEKANKAFDLICEALSQNKHYLDLHKHLSE